MELIRRLQRRMTAVSGWPLWSLPRWLTVYVLTVVAVDAAAIGLAASFTTFTRANLALFGLLLACTAISVELTRKAGEQGGMIKDVQLTTIDGGPHAISWTHADQVTAALLKFMA